MSHVYQWLHLFHDCNDSQADGRDLQQPTKQKHNIFFTGGQTEPTDERREVAGKDKENKRDRTGQCNFTK